MLQHVTTVPCRCRQTNPLQHITTRDNCMRKFPTVRGVTERIIKRKAMSAPIELEHYPSKFIKLLTKIEFLGSLLVVTVWSIKPLRNHGI